jgi:hypothetical protein
MLRADPDTITAMSKVTFRMGWLDTKNFINLVLTPVVI